jgi:hypothetical protein
MKNLIFSALLVLFFALSASAQNQKVLVNTFKVESRLMFNMPTSNENIEFLQDNSLGLGIIRVEVVIDHNAPQEIIKDLVKNNRYSFEQTSQEIIFKVSQKQVFWGRSTELTEKFKICIYMSKATSKLK